MSSAGRMDKREFRNKLEQVQHELDIDLESLFADHQVQ